MDLTEFQDTDSVKNMLEIVKSLGINRIDTAPRYPPLSPGRAEELLGEVRELAGEFILDSKIYTDTKTNGSGDLSQHSMKLSIDGSLARLKRPHVNVLYSHRPDPTTPLEDQIKNFNEQIAEGHCKAWGISNTPPATLEAILTICEENGWQKPSAYQGDYNLVTRGMENRLLPTLRAHGISFVAFRTLGAGFLTGNAVNNQREGTRMSDDNPLGKAMKKVFDEEVLKQAVKTFDEKVKAHGLSSLEVAIRWIFHHSVLHDDDGIILGASKGVQLQETVSLIWKGALSSPILAVVEDLWAAVQPTRGNVL
ncbi:hypothetical protein N0V82_009094 [Gnomoniopsis sp. IMI 355080]|nr:hypothetical protein N0V82_009094 [Gnomoniopsis sp. IMI 355080]